MDEKSLQLHGSLVERLPPLLRIYVGCASQLIGDVESADLVKIHLYSGKLSLMKFDNFSGCALPRMLERVKINFRVSKLKSLTTRIPLFHLTCLKVTIYQ